MGSPLFSIATLKKHPALIPLVVIIGIGGGLAGGILWRLATQSPDVTWNRSGNPEPWEKYRNKQYKFYSPNIDYSKLECPAPDYRKGVEESK
ncbi:cytochrome c oxidase subunit NDUFA4 [Sitodiplosis mosellana]|uniref:cytochrome c oxidase subunit NDUFA4 n=1 Tax=Sitodiplosis mosellana TaxID=263140 RepID=UPI00244397B9|nr:cytochrome c oxidase subunit NDUFA4 [Sitodiplosis mosellana]